MPFYKRGYACIHDSTTMLYMCHMVCVYTEPLTPEVRILRFAPRRMRGRRGHALVCWLEQPFHISCKCVHVRLTFVDGALSLCM